MRTRLMLMTLAGLLLVTATGCLGRCKRSCNSSFRSDLPPVPADYCPTP